MNSLRTILFAIASCFLLSACINIKSEMSFYEDERVEFYSNALINHQFAALYKQEEGKSVCMDFGQEIILRAGIFCESGESIVNIADLDDFVDPNDIIKLDIHKQANGVYQLVLGFQDLPAEIRKELDVLSYSNPEYMKAIQIMLADSFYEISVNAAQIIKTNGRILNGGRRAEILIPMADFILDSVDNFEVTFRIK